MTTTILRKRFCELCLGRLSQTRSKVAARLYSSTKLTNREARQKRNEMFENEKKRQESFIKRIEKINVSFGDTSLIMNKDLSTPYNCALHISDVLARRSVVAQVNGKLWDMHSPLTEDCNLKLLHMLDEDARQQNKIFWRTCSFILGYVLENSFKDDVYVELCGFPGSKVESGSFVYDVDWNLPGWNPSFVEFNTLGLEASTFCGKKLDFERLEVDKNLALEMFEDNRFKAEQIPAIAERNGQDRVILYRVGDHVDVTKGPLLANTGQIGRFSVTAMYDIHTEKYGTLKRVQGVALPQDTMVHESIYTFLCKAGRRKNNEGIHLYRNRRIHTEESTETGM